MKSKLLFLDLLLLVIVGWAGTTLKERLDGARQREMAILRQRIPQIPPPAVAPIPPVGSVRAATYLDVAQQLLFARDRNPDVIPDPPKPPPPPVPVPPLPHAHGVMQFGNKATVILSESSADAHKSYQPGDEIGPFKLLAVNNTHILFEWNGLRILKTIEEITDRSAPPPSNTTAQNAEPAKPAESTQASTSSEAKEGPSNIDMGNETKACLPGDKSPNGTVMNGMRKVVQATPFGNSCRWVPAK